MGLHGLLVPMTKLMAFKKCEQILDRRNRLDLEFNNRLANWQLVRSLSACPLDRQLSCIVDVFKECSSIITHTDGRIKPKVISLMYVMKLSFEPFHWYNQLFSAISKMLNHVRMEISVSRYTIERDQHFNSRKQKQKKRKEKAFVTFTLRP